MSAPISSSDAIESSLCGICHDEVESPSDRALGGRGVKILHCGHPFHTICIDKWLINNTTCPVGRQTVHSGERPSGWIELPSDGSNCREFRRVGFYPVWAQKGVPNNLLEALLSSAQPIGASSSLDARYADNAAAFTRAKLLRDRGIAPDVYYVEPSGTCQASPQEVVMAGAIQVDPTGAAHLPD